MRIEIIQIHMSPGGTGHEHIERLKWRNGTKSGEGTRQAIVDWLRSASNTAFVANGVRQAEVGIVEARPPYLRTHADGVWTNNLLALPRY